MTNKPGWYPDPSGQPFQRFWNGVQWTDDTSQPFDAQKSQPPARPHTFPTRPLPTVAPPSAPTPGYKRKGFIIAGSVVGALVVIGGISSAISPKNKGTPAAASSTINSMSSKPASVAPVTPSSKATPVPSMTSHAAPPVVHTTADSADDGSFPMPNEVGQILQAAQDDLQRVSGNPIYISHSHDLLGSRHQVLDGNWRVCNQNVAPGASVTDGMSVDFGVVKVEESCP